MFTTTLAQRVALGLIRGYQLVLSPLLPGGCRFDPSCSRYTYHAIERYGLSRGLRLGAARLSRCHPWSAGGYDPVP